MVRVPGIVLNTAAFFNLSLLLPDYLVFRKKILALSTFLGLILLQFRQ